MGERIVHILFVEYHAAFRQAASPLMDREADLEVVAQGGSVREGREKMARGHRRRCSKHTLTRLRLRQDSRAAAQSQPLHPGSGAEPYRGP